MARSLFKLASFFTPTRILTLRLRSTLPEALETVAATKEEAERVAMKKLEEAVHRIIVKRAEPGWLPLVPGGSYWVPPKAKARGFADVVHKLLKDSTNVTDHALELCSTRAWPSSPHFFKGASNSPLEGEMTTSAIKTEEEEGLPPIVNYCRRWKLDKFTRGIEEFRDLLLIIIAQQKEGNAEAASLQ